MLRIKALNEESCSSEEEDDDNLSIEAQVQAIALEIKLINYLL